MAYRPTQINPDAPSDEVDATDALTQVLEYFTSSEPVSPNHLIKYVTNAYLDSLDIADPPDPDTIERMLLLLRTAAVKAQNPKREQGDKLKVADRLEPIQAAMIVTRLLHVAEVTPGGANADDGLGILSIYQTTGEFAGLYRRADLGLLSDLARDYCYTHDATWFKEFERAVLQLADKATEEVNPDLVPMRNVIFNYRTDERIDYCPAYVFTKKAATDIIDKQHAVPEVLDDDGNVIWNYETWNAQTYPDDGVRAFMDQVRGAALRPRNDWQKMVALYSQTGSNGKGTEVAHIRSIVGDRSCVSIPLKAYSTQFGKEQLIGAQFNAPDETPVGNFINDASDLKAIITNDPIFIDRKHEKPITFKPAMFTILNLNGALNFRDKTASMDRRLGLVPMEAHFPDGVKNKAIKNDYLLRREVREYVAYKVLIETPKYWEFDEPELVKNELRRHKRETNTVVSFYEEYKDEFTRPFLPLPMLFALSRASLQEKSRSQGADVNDFSREIVDLFDPEEWVVPTAVDKNGRTVNRRMTVRHWLNGPENVLEEFGTVPSVAKWQWCGGVEGLPRATPRQAAGLMRRDYYEAWVAAGTPTSASGVAHILRDIQAKEAAALAQIATQSADQWVGGNGDGTTLKDKLNTTTPTTTTTDAKEA